MVLRRRTWLRGWCIGACSRINMMETLNPPICVAENKDVDIDGSYPQASRNLRNLRESIDSLLGSNDDFTHEWTETVRLIIHKTINDPSHSACISGGALSSEEEEKEKDELKGGISKLEEELSANWSLFQELDSTRRTTLCKLLDLKGNIRVLCRMRPFLPSEKKKNVGPILLPEPGRVVTKNKFFDFDKVFLPTASQDEVFAEVEPVIKSALDGSNVCIFAYGQTGTGKTFTMEGTSDCPGIIPRTIQELFNQAALDPNAGFTFTFSMFEVYMRQMRDLLAPRTTKSADYLLKCPSIKMDPKGSFEVHNVNQKIVTTMEQAIRLYKRGRKSRSTTATNANETSSRSHCLMRISISCSGDMDRYGETNKLWMVDLGGSERLQKTKATGQTMEEGKEINTSLFVLGKVISALQNKEIHIPYRDNILTQILKDSLGEGSKTLMLVHISPKADDLGETERSLKFATQASGVQLETNSLPEANVQKEEEIAMLMQQIRTLEDACHRTKSMIQAAKLQLREKKKQLSKLDPLLEEHDQSETYEDDRRSDTQSINSGNVAERSVGLPRYMASTASSRVRDVPLSPIKPRRASLGTSQLNLESRRFFSSTSSMYSRMDRSICDTESIVSNRTNTLSHTKRLSLGKGSEFQLQGATNSLRVSSRNSLSNKDITSNHNSRNQHSGGNPNESQSSNTHKTQFASSMSRKKPPKHTSKPSIPKEKNTVALNAIQCLSESSACENISGLTDDANTDTTLSQVKPPIVTFLKDIENISGLTDNANTDTILSQVKPPKVTFLKDNEKTSSIQPDSTWKAHSAFECNTPPIDTRVNLQHFEVSDEQKHSLKNNAVVFPHCKRVIAFNASTVAKSGSNAFEMPCKEDISKCLPDNLPEKDECDNTRIPEKNNQSPCLKFSTSSIATDDNSRTEPSCTRLVNSSPVSKADCISQPLNTICHGQATESNYEMDDFQGEKFTSCQDQVSEVNSNQKSPSETSSSFLLQHDNNRTESFCDTSVASSGAAGMQFETHTTTSRWLCYIILWFIKMLWIGMLLLKLELGFNDDFFCVLMR